jgi:flavodoxin
MTRSLIVFYSLDGFTERIAKAMATKIGLDLLHLHPKQDIKKSGLKFMKYFRGGKQVLMKEIPELHPYICDISTYDIIYIGTPVRAYTYTPAIRAFLSQTQIKNKKLILFCTHEGGPGKTLANLTHDLNGNSIIKTKDFNRKILEYNEEALMKEIDDLLF